jgi:predicted AlkP superfamily pyrophosphatase or phosphodiesterase
MRIGWAAASIVAVLGLAVPGLGAETRHAVVVSVDGLMPAYYLRADELGLRMPHLRRLMARGAYGRVTGVLPSVTYPSHTTLITGVPPRLHGILSNTVFDPEGRSNGAWMWYASSVRVATLVSAARARGLRTAAVSWPVSVGLPADHNLPEFWRSGSEHPSDLALLEALSTTGLVGEIVKERGKPLPYPLTDAERVEAAVHIIRRHRPNLLLLHVFELDSKQHDHGPSTPEAKQAVEESDAALGRVLEAVADAGMAATTLFAVVSDHGFLPVSQRLRPNARLREAGLLSLDDKGKVGEWRAYFHTDGGSAALRLKDPEDRAVLGKVRALFAADAGRRGSGIFRILEPPDIERLGGDPEAALGLDAESGSSFSSAVDGSYLTPSRPGGTHGHGPDREELQAALVMTGPGLKPRDLGLVRMTAIAPTIARFLGVELSAKADSPLEVFSPAKSAQAARTAGTGTPLSTDARR